MKSETADQPRAGCTDVRCSDCPAVPASRCPTHAYCRSDAYAIDFVGLTPDERLLGESGNPSALPGRLPEFDSSRNISGQVVAIALCHETGEQRVADGSPATRW